MSVRTILRVEDNTAPPIVLTAKREGVSINLTNCTVDLILAKGSTITNAGHQPAVVTTPASGVVTYSPQTGDFPSAGSYKGDLKVTYLDGTFEVLYDQLKVKVRRKLQ